MQDTDALEECVTQWMAEKPAIGLAVAVVRHGEIVWQGGYGVTSCEDGAGAVSPLTIFRILSTTKLLTGTAIMRLVEQGVLDLDTPVSAWLPGFHFTLSDVADHITLRHLLSHTSGLPTFRGDVMTTGSDGLEWFVRDYLPAYPLLVSPGKVWLYSNAGMMLAAYIAQTVTGAPYRELMDTLVFAPLEMRRTTFDPLVALTYPCAQALQKGSDGSLEVVHTFAQNTAWDPAGGAMSCVSDMGRLALMYLGGGHYRHQQLLQPETIQMMQAPVVHTFTQQDEGYGLAFATEQYKGVDLVRHNGGGVASYASYFYLAPEQQTGVILLSNGGPQRGLITALLDLLLAFPATKPPRDVTEDQPFWPRYVGTYLGIYTGLVEVHADMHHLRLTRNGKAFILHPRGAHQFVGKAETDDETISLGFVDVDDDGADPILILDDSPCQRVPPIPAIAPEPAGWARFVGDYELPAATLMSQHMLHISLNDEALALTQGQATYRCIPLGGKQFACDAGLLAFHDGPHGIELEMWRTMTASRIESLDDYA